MRRRPSNRDLAWVLGAAAVAAIGAAWLLHALTDAPTPTTAIPAPRSATAPATPPVPSPVRSTTLPVIRLAPPYEVSDGITILTESRRIRLAGVEAPAAEAVCYDPGERLWACGLQARAALHALIRNQTLSCRATGEAHANATLAACSAGSTPLDRALVRQGFARPVVGEGPFPQDLAEAKAEGRGLWNGGWRIRP